jgi:uncharacterized protein (UPF0248 family)
MMPIHELLSRIRHDREFGRGWFEIGYFDRMEDSIHRVAFHQVSLPAGERRVLEVADEGEQVRRIQSHRVREVWCDGQIIWWRAAKPGAMPRSPTHTRVFGEDAVKAGVLN